MALGLLAACAVEHGNPAPGGGAAQAPGASPGAGMAGAVPGAVVAPGPMHQVFDSVREHIAIGVDRISLDVMLDPAAPRAVQQATLEAVAEAERRADSTLGGIRVAGFYPPAAGHGQHPSGLRMIPSALLTWVPLGGWNAVARESLRAPHVTEVEFVSDLPNHHPAPGAGTGR